MQYVLLGEAPSGPLEVASLNFKKPNSRTGFDYICWSDAWDKRHACFSECFLPVVAAVPVLIALLTLLLQALGLLVTRRPTWTENFVQERAPISFETSLIRRRRWTPHLITLALILAVGTLLQLAYVLTVGYIGIAASVGHIPVLEPLAPLVTWLVTLSVVLIQRPRTTPVSVLIILVLQAITQVVRFTSSVFRSGHDLAWLIPLLVLDCLAILAILNMPLRDPLVQAKDISKPFTEPTSALRSPEDNLTLLQWMTVSWMTPLIKIGHMRQLDDEDVWQLPFAFHHHFLHDKFRNLKGSVMRRLIKANLLDIIILIFLGILRQITQFSQPVLLQCLLVTMEDTEAPKRAAVGYAALALAVRIVAVQITVFSLWFGRRCYERSRGEMITMLYEKTLNRKIGFFEDHPKEDLNSNGVANGQSGKTQPLSRWQKARLKVKSAFKRTRNQPPPKQPATMGKILNLMRNDIYETAQRFWEVSEMAEKPLAVVFSVTLVVRFLGPTALLAMAVIVAAQVLVFGLAKIYIHYEKKRRQATDKKLQVITQFVEALRHLRWYGWQGAWLQDIMTARQQELNLRIISACWSLAINFCNNMSVDVTPVVGFFAYTVIAGKELRVDVAFPAMQLFSMMNSSLRELPSLIIVWINALVAVARIEDFMAEPDIDEAATEALIGDSLALERASFAWPGSSLAVLRRTTLSFPQGLSVVCGEVAAGKTALLQALLGELDMLEGQLIRPAEAIGYCAQTPWLQSMSVRENILFGGRYDDKRYKDVLDACALTPDLAEFKAGDLSMIGENGVGLSGGQRARCALARAVYSSARILLLDDPLSALDQQTAEAIVKNCFAGPLMKDRTVVLVTHRTDLVLGIADQVINIDQNEATVVEQDDITLEKLRRSNTSHSKDEESEEQHSLKIKAIAVPDKFIEDEHRAHGSVQAKVYWEFIKAGKLYLWAILVVLMVVHRLASYGESWFIKAWGEAYQTKSQLSNLLLIKGNDAALESTSSIFDGLPAPEVNIRPWLIGLGLLSTTQSVVGAIAQAIMLTITYSAGRRMFRDIMQKVTHATFRFYDVTPVGRLMNRMTSDIGVIDGNISERIRWVAWFFVSWVSAIVVIASVTPIFLVFTVLLTITFILIFARFIPTSQSLRRLEMTSLSPLMSNFGALLQGLTTVRAFRAQSQFQDRVIEVVDTFQKMDHFYWSLAAWLSSRYEALAATATFTLTLLAVWSGISPGLTAFTLYAAEKFVSSTHRLCHFYGRLQMEFVSVERVIELLELEQEPRGEVSPPAWWPSFSGSIQFQNVTIRYAPHNEPALSDVSFTIQGGSKTAIIGRTGSGKSTLALSILATVLPESGKILVDNVDLAVVDKQILRTRVTFLAQDPVLFPGTMRQNLDPVNEQSDEACAAVLDRVCGRQGWKLDDRIEAHGANLSQGQRQLVGLARAVLRRSAIIILDEATASIDRETAMQIQQVLHEELKESTVITIAHRLEAVRNADYCIVLGKGKILEQGPADEMLRDHKEDMMEDR